MGDWLTHRARTAPEEIGLIEADGGTEWTYAELDAAVAGTAGRLAALGVEAGDHLGVLMETRVAFVRLVHAAMRVGAVLVPLNARLAEPELTRQTEVADLNLVVCERETESEALRASEMRAGSDDPRASDAVATAAVPVASVDSPEADAVCGLPSADPADFDPAAWSRNDSMAMLFTSGTTGDPKAVELTVGNFLSSAVSSAFRLGATPDDRWLLCLSMYHTGGLSVVLRSALYGTTVVLQETREGFDAGAAADAIAEYAVTGVSLVPTMLRRMLDSRESLSDSLRFVLLGGAPAPDELLARCEDRGVPVCPTYGMTETASQIATARPREAFEYRGTVGRPLLWTDVTVVGSDGRPVGPEEAGELVVSGPTVMAGYYGDPAATDEAVGEYGLHTGDVGYRDEAGRVWVLNRREDRIVTGGENVHPGEVVEALRDHSAVRDAAVVGLDDDEWGERVGALVVPEGEGNGDADDGPADLSAEEIEAHCRERLAGYKRPRTVGFADELPRTASGTVEREAVRERLRDIRD